VLYSFTGFADGAYPVANLVLDRRGNLYGTTMRGGANNYGTVFEITSSGTERVLYSFCSQQFCQDGSDPEAGLVLKGDKLYGTTYDGGIAGAGTVFEITRSGAERVLYNFGSQSLDGTFPQAGLVFDRAGNLYGTTYSGGANNLGTVFEITRSGTERVLYSFGSESEDGAYPVSGLVFDKLGNLYGTTGAGGISNNGTVFQITASGEEKVLHKFCSQPNCMDGATPYAGLVVGKSGDLFGTAAQGGLNGKGGVVFRLTP